MHLVSWNGEKYIPFLFDSLRAQIFDDWELHVWDNHSTDSTAEKIAVELLNFNRVNTFTIANENMGFVGGHNALFHNSLQSDARYTMLLNQDMMLDENFIDRLFYFMECHSDVGAASGCLFRWDFPQKTNVIDTMGLHMLKNHRVIEYHGGEEWRDEEERVKAVEVFGVSGALPVYRNDALRDVVYRGEVFDDDFFSYKEDVDLAWRLRLAGWQACTILDAIAFHDRSASGSADLSNRFAASNRSSKSIISNTYSYRNHLFMLFKNIQREEFPSLWPTVWYELKKAVYLFFCDHVVFWKSWWSFIKLFPKLWEKRVYIIDHRRAEIGEIARWKT